MIGDRPRAFGHQVFCREPPWSRETGPPPLALARESTNYAAKRPVRQPTIRVATAMTSIAKVPIRAETVRERFFLSIAAVPSSFSERTDCRRADWFNPQPGVSTRKRARSNAQRHRRRQGKNAVRDLRNGPRRAAIRALDRRPQAIIGVVRQRSKGTVDQRARIVAVFGSDNSDRFNRAVPTLPGPLRRTAPRLGADSEVSGPARIRSS